MSGSRSGPMWVRVLLRLYPATFRRAHAAEVKEYVARETAGQRVGWSRLGVAMRLAWDLLRGAARVRFVAASRRNRRRGLVERLGDAVRAVRRAARGLLRAPAFAATVVATMALGIGLATGIFSALNAVLLRPFDYASPERLVYVSTHVAGAEDVLMAGATLTKLRERQRTFDDLAGVAVIRQNLTGPELPRQVEVGWTTANLFELLGVEAEIGRVFRAGDPMGTALLSWRSWQRDFGGDGSVVGGTIRLDERVYTVVGVLPRGFALHIGTRPREIDVWKVPDTWWQNGDIWAREGAEFGLLQVVGRLAAGADLEAVRADLAGVAAGLRAEVPSYEESELRLTVTPLRAHVVSSSRAILLLLMGAVCAVMLIACANVTGLLLVRAEDRKHEVAVRMALGSGPARVAGHVLAESALLAGAGGVLGLVAAQLGMKLLPWVAPANVPRLANASLDGRVLLFATVVTMLCTLLVGLGPAVRSARGSPRVPSGMRATHDRRQRRARSALVAAQIAVSLALLVCASLLAGSVDRLRRVDTGFDADDVLTFAVSLPGARYGWPEETHGFLEQLEDRVRALPGVTSAAVVWPLPLDGRRWDGSVYGGRIREEDRHLARYELVTPAFFETLGIDVSGRTFGGADPKRAVLVSRSLAERAWPGEDAIGKTLRAFPWGQDTVRFSVIGVAKDVRFGSLQAGPDDAVYFDSEGYVWTDWEVNFVVHGRADPGPLAERIRREVAALDPEIPVASIRPLADLVDANMAIERFARSVFVVFATSAGLLVVLGLYAVVSYGVRLRRREFGVRLALGSGVRGILGLVLRQGLLLAAAGIGIGLIAASAAARSLRGLLFEITAHEPVAYAASAVAMLAVAIIATIVPARRASRLDPATVLRAE